MILEAIVAYKREELQRRKAQHPLAEVRRRAEEAPPPRDFAAAIRRPSARDAVRLIAEVKRASPSRGTFRADLDPVALAETYVANGARALSVLTDERFFQGRLEELTAVRQHLETLGRAAPILRKDFLFDPYQVYEARAAGADAVLLIVAILEDTQLADLLALARELGMAALVEVHDREELERALAVGPRVIGVNNRDLRDFHVDLGTTERLRPFVPGATILVAESGIHTAADVQRLARVGVDAVLVGEALVTAEDTAARVRELSGQPVAGSR